MRQVPEATLRAIEQHFHEVIRGRAAALIDEQNLTLPKLAPLLADEKGFV